MPQFFFNQVDGEFRPDDEGLELQSLDEARVEAVRFAGEVLRHHPTLVWAGEDFRVEVTNQQKLVLFTLIVLGVDAPAGAASTNRALKP